MISSMKTKVGMSMRTHMLIMHGIVVLQTVAFLMIVQRLGSDNPMSWQSLLLAIAIMSSLTIEYLEHFKSVTGKEAFMLMQLDKFFGGKVSIEIEEE